MLDVPKTFSSLMNPSLDVPFICLPNLIDNLGNTQFSTCNFGVIFNSDLRFNNQIPQVVPPCFLQLRNIAKVINILCQADVEVITYAFVSSPLDDCNSLYSGLDHRAISHLQLIQNSAARLRTSSASQRFSLHFAGCQ